MYTDKRVNYRRLFICILILALLAAAFAVFYYRTSVRDLKEEGTAAVEYTIRKSAKQCYAVEGFYPQDIDYLTENYGLQINKKDYYITYDVFAENVAPDIRVRRKK